MIRDDVRLGIDLGTASCGWAVVQEWHEQGERRGRILGMGSRIWDAPETDKERVPTNQLRRTARGMRRVMRRRRQRMGQVRLLLFEAGLIPGADRDALRISGLDPWELRAEGLDRLLTGAELAVALGHIAKHRGFKSNSKADRGANASPETSAMKAEIERTQDRLEGRTVGQMFARDERYSLRKRNRGGGFDRSVLRDDQAAEVRAIFAVQRRLSNPSATMDLATRFARIAFSQRPLRDSEDRVGRCTFEPTEPRAAKRAPSFELCRFLQRLATLRVGVGRDERPLSPAEFARAEAEFGKHKEFTWKALRKATGLGDNIRFAGVSPGDEKNDFVSRQGKAAEGTASLRGVIAGGAGELAWLSLLDAPHRLDGIARVLTFRDDLDSIRAGLGDLGLDPAVVAALMEGVEGGRTFSAFKGAGHLSATACRRLLPHLRAGLDYAGACAAAGYDHAARPGLKFGEASGRELWCALRAIVEEVANPVARKALGEAVKQVKVVVEEHGLPGAIHVELARDVGKGKDERDEITRGIEKRTKAKERLREQFRQDVGRLPRPGSADLMKFELYNEQRHFCLYSGEHMPIADVFGDDNYAQVDHILPWSRSGDDSFRNKILCRARQNAEKQDRTPFEWFGDDERRWSTFEAAVMSNTAFHRRKKKLLTLKNAGEVLGKFRSRNLNDTRYACRLLLDALKHLYPRDEEELDEAGQPRRRVRVFARPGPLTDRLRRAWGIQGLKKDAKGERIADDRHHGLDAVIVAATTNAALQRFTMKVQEAEKRGAHRDFADFEPPWRGFRADAERAHADVFVSRAERRRARGEAHGATIRAIETLEGRSVVIERKAIEKLTEADLARIKDPERNREIVDALRLWIAAGKPSSREALPVKRFGGKVEQARTEPIRKVSLISGKKPDVLVRDGAADRGEMTRVDVFRKVNRRGTWDYFLVPIYPHQIFDPARWKQPPNRAVSANMDEEEWPEMGSAHEFCWSLYPLSLVELTKPNGEVILGYLRSMSRSTGAFSVSPHQSLQEMRQGIGGRTLAGFKKFTVDRLGRRFEIERETRTWHGVACT